MIASCRSEGAGAPQRCVSFGVHLDPLARRPSPDAPGNDVAREPWVSRQRGCRHRDHGRGARGVGCGCRNALLGQGDRTMMMTTCASRPSAVPAPRVAARQGSFLCVQGPSLHMDTLTVQVPRVRIRVASRRGSPSRGSRERPRGRAIALGSLARQRTPARHQSTGERFGGGAFVRLAWPMNSPRRFSPSLSSVVPTSKEDSREKLSRKASTGILHRPDFATDQHGGAAGDSREYSAGDPVSLGHAKETLT